MQLSNSAAPESSHLDPEEQNAPEPVLPDAALYQNNHAQIIMMQYYPEPPEQVFRTVHCNFKLQINKDFHLHYLTFRLLRKFGG